MSRLILMGIFIIVVAVHKRLDRKHELMLECYMESSYSMSECLSLVTISDEQLSVALLAFQKHVRLPTNT